MNLAILRTLYSQNFNVSYTRNYKDGKPHGVHYVATCCSCNMQFQQESEQYEKQMGSHDEVPPLILESMRHWNARHSHTDHEQGMLEKSRSGKYYIKKVTAFDGVFVWSRYEGGPYNFTCNVCNWNLNGSELPTLLRTCGEHLLMHQVGGTSFVYKPQWWDGVASLVDGGKMPAMEGRFTLFKGGIDG